LKITTGILLAALTALSACSGQSRPDPLHSYGKKKILKRSVFLLPEWVTAQKDLWFKRERVVVKIYHEGETSLSNAFYVTATRMPELARLVLKDYIRDLWLSSPLSEKISNVRFQTALYLNTVFTKLMDAALSNQLVSKFTYWELWQKETEEETRRAFTVYHLLHGEKKGLDSLIRKQAATMPMIKGAEKQLINLQRWLRKGPLTHPLL